MEKRFIVLIDFSDQSANLLRYAYEWSSYINASLLLVHQTIVLMPGFADAESKKEMALQTNKEAIEKIKNFAGTTLPNVENIRYHVSDVSLMLTIPALLKEPIHQLLFAGLKGTGKLKQITLGSVSLQIIENTGAITVAIPGNISSFNPKKIYVGISDKHTFNVIAFNRLLEFKYEGLHEIIFFYLAKPNEKNAEIENLLADLVSLFSGRWFNTHYEIYEGNDSFKAIKRVINNHIDELLVIQKGSRYFTDQLFRNFLVNELVYEGETPMIILP